MIIWFSLDNWKLWETQEPASTAYLNLSHITMHTLTFQLSPSPWLQMLTSIPLSSNSLHLSVKHLLNVCSIIETSMHQKKRSKKSKFSMSGSDTVCLLINEFCKDCSSTVRQQQVWAYGKKGSLLVRPIWVTKDGILCWLSCCTWWWCWSRDVLANASFYSRYPSILMHTDDLHSPKSELSHYMRFYNAMLFHAPTLEEKLLQMDNKEVNNVCKYVSYHLFINDTWWHSLDYERNEWPEVDGPWIHQTCLSYLCFLWHGK